MSLFSINGLIYGTVLVGVFYASKLVFGNKLEEIIAKKA